MLENLLDRPESSLEAQIRDFFILLCEKLEQAIRRCGFKDGLKICNIQESATLGLEGILKGVEPSPQSLYSFLHPKDQVNGMVIHFEKLSRSE